MSGKRVSATAIRDHLCGRLGDMKVLLSDLVSVESPSDVPESQASILAMLASQLERIGYLVWRIPGRRSGGHLYARPRARSRFAPAQLLLGHCDTVWPLGTLKSMPMEFDDTSARGPGVYDMKAGLVEIVFALCALHELDLNPPLVPLVFINSDEEIGSRESTRYVRALARRVDRAMVMEPSLGPKGMIKTTRKGVGRFTIRVRGKAAHAGLDPAAGASAILELSHVIQKLFALNNPDSGATVNVGLIDGGMRPNVIAPESSAIVDVRIETHEEADRIEREILSLRPETPGVQLSVEGGIGRPPMEPTPLNRQLWRVAADIGTELGLDLREGMAGGGSDGNTTSQYTATIDGLGAVGDGAHAAHEFIYLDQLPERCALLTLLLLAPPIHDLAPAVSGKGGTA